MTRSRTDDHSFGSARPTAHTVRGTPPLLQLTPVDAVSDGAWSLRAGAWCDAGEGADGVPTLGPVWEGKDTMRRAFTTATDAHQALLPVLARALDAVHGTRSDERYWHVVLGPFLVWYLETLLDRLRVLRAAAAADPAPALAATPPTVVQPAVDTRDFMRLASENDTWNRALFERINAAQSILATTEGAAPHAAPPLPAPEHEPLTRLSRLVAATKRAAAPAARRAHVVAHLSYGLGRGDALELALASRGTVQRFEPTVHLPAAPRARDDEMRQALDHHLRIAAGARRTRSGALEDPEARRLYDLALALLPDDLPTSALERLQVTRAHAARLPYRAAGVVISDTGWYFDEVFKVWAAERYARGAMLVSVQHGGGYGAREVDTGEWFERSITDRFLSWGWSGEDVIPLPAPRLTLGLRSAPARGARNGALLWAWNAVPRYVYSLESWPQSGQYLAYLRWQQRFVDALAPQVAERVVYRPYTRDYGWDAVREVIGDRRDLRADTSGNYRFLETLAGASCFLCDNLNTTYLQAVAMDVPTILFWDPTLFPTNAEHRAWEERLADVGVLHRTPESAAAQLARILPDLDVWWSDPVRRRVVDAYRQRYARTDPAWPKAWRTTFGRARRASDHAPAEPGST